jgi:hypothetical protein
MHTAVKAVIVLVALIGAGTIGMAALGFCPPAGPWPFPPWCSDKTQFPQDTSAVAGGIFGSGTGSAAQPTPAPAGTPLTVTFRAAVPETDRNVTLSLSGTDYPMNRETPYLFASAGIPVTSGDTLKYLYKAGDLETAVVEKTVTRDGEIGKGRIWTSTPLMQKPGFVKGHTLMDAGGNIPAAAKSGYLWSTFDAMKEDGGEYVAYDYYWAYRNTSAPEIVDEAAAGMWNAADENTIGLMADEAHKQGLEFALYTELEWTVMPGEFPTGDNDAYMKYQENKWTQGQKTVQEMADRLAKNPADPAANEYWDRWFTQFGNFMQKSAEIAEKHNIGMLALGKQIDGAMIPANEQRWRALIADVRKVYHGKLTQVLFTDEWSDPESQVPWIDDLDVITIYYYNRFSDAERPSLAELESAMDSFNRKQFDPLYAKYKKPIIFLLPFQSRDHAAGQAWFEPMATAPSVRQDFLAQADLYEAFFSSMADEPWCGGAMTWGYWIEPGFNPKYSFEKSSSVRGKPAALVIQRLFAQVKS